MPKIRINLKTTEIAVEGSELFVNNYIDTIKEIITASFRGYKLQEKSPCPRNVRPALPKKSVEPEVTVIPAAKQPRHRSKRHPDMPRPDTLQEITPDSPPVRKYILRKVDGTVSRKGDNASVVLQ